MATAKVCCSRPEKRATRPTGMGRVTIISLPSDGETLKATDLQAQRLCRSFAWSAHLAAAVSSIIWETHSER